MAVSLLQLWCTCLRVLSALFRGLFVIVYACVVHVMSWHVHGFVAMFQDAPGLV